RRSKPRIPYRRFAPDRASPSARAPLPNTKRERRAPRKERPRARRRQARNTLPGGLGRCRRRGIGLLDLRSLILRGTLDEQLRRFDVTVLIAADGDDRDRVAEVARPDAAVDDTHSVAARIEQVEGELLASRVVTVALLVESSHDLHHSSRA